MLEQKKTADRIYILDTMRLFAVISVVALHAGIVYAPVVPWWYVLDKSKNAVFDILLFATDGFVMPALFFIAGYFALSSLRRYGAVDFLLAKFKRLGVPLVVLTIFTCPIISYVIYRGQQGQGTYFRYWMDILSTAVHWKYVELDPRMMTTFILPFHLWFLSLLLVFCSFLALFRVLSSRWRRDGRSSRPGSGLGLFILLALVTGVAEAVGQIFFPDIAWVAFGPFLLLQPARLPLYLGMFLLGAYAWDRNWFTEHRIPGTMWVWGVAAVVTFLAMARCGGAIMAPHPKSFLIFATYGLMRTLFALAFIGFLVAWGQRFWNRPSGVGAALSAASYDIYLAHFPLVVVLQYLLVASDTAVFFKFGVIFSGSIFICWGVSHIVRPLHKEWMAAMVVGGLALCLLVWT